MMAQAPLNPFLPGLEPPPEIDALFFAIVPDAAVISRITALKAQMRTAYGSGANWRPAHVLHVTLHGIGRYDGLPGDVVARSRQAGAAVHVQPFEIRFDRVRTFRRGRKRTVAPVGGRHGAPVVLYCADGAPPLLALRERLGDAMRGARTPPLRPAGFTPHMTLLYSDDILAERRLEEPITASVQEFVLVHSRQGATRHRHLGRWPLRG